MGAFLLPRNLRRGRSSPMSRGSRIAAAVVVGVALGCLCAFLYPDGLFPRAPDSAIHWPRRIYQPSSPTHCRPWERERKNSLPICPSPQPLRLIELGKYCWSTPLFNTTIKVLDSTICAFLAYTSLDTEPKRGNLRSTNYTSNTMCDTMIAATVQGAENGKRKIQFKPWEQMLNDLKHGDELDMAWR